MVDIILTFILVICIDSENCVSDVFVLVHLGLVQAPLKVWRIVVLVHNLKVKELYETYGKLLNQFIMMLRRKNKNIFVLGLV